MNQIRQEITYIGRELLHASETNPRKHFAQGALEELGKSIEVQGIIQPLIVRVSVPWTERMSGVTHYEIVAGERRYRSGCAVGLMEFPTIVRVLADWEVVELQLIENLQREDVTAYEEAVGYASLLELVDAAGEKLYTPERIAGKIGKSESYVAHRLNVRQAPAELLEAMVEGIVGVKVVERVGKFPHRADRERLAAEVLRPKHSDKPMTFRELEKHIAEHYQNSLKGAVFDGDDVSLVKGAGACAVCPYRSGNDPELEGLLQTGRKGEGRGSKGGADPNLCLNPNCFRAKTEAHYKQAEKAGEVEVIPVKEAAKLFPYGDYLSYNSSYRLASEKPGYDDIGHYDGKKVKSWGAYAASLGVKVSVAKSPHTGALIEVVERSAVKTAEQLAAKKDGRPSVFAKQRSTENTAARKNDADRQKRDKAILDDSIRRALDGVSEAMLGGLTTDAVLIALASVVDHEGIDILMRWMGLKAQSKPGAPVMRQDKVDAIVAEASDSARYDLEGVMILVVVASLVKTMPWYGLNDSRFTKLAALLGVDLKECHDQAKVSVKAAWAEKAKKSVQEGKNGKGKVGKESVKRDADRVEAHFAKKGGMITRVTIQRALDWSEERTIAAYDELVSRGVIAAQATRVGESRDTGHGEEAHTKSQSHEANSLTPEISEDVRAVVVECLRRSGTVKVGWQEICDILGAGLDADARERGLKVFDAMMDLGLIVKGVFNTAGVDAVFPQKDADEVEVKSANVPGSGKSKLAAAVSKKKAGKPSDAWMASPDLARNEKLLGKLQNALMAWGPESVFDPVWVKAWVSGVTDDSVAALLLAEAVHRGLIFADQVAVAAKGKGGAES